MAGALHLSVDGDHVAIVEIDNPPMNMFDQALSARFVAILDQLEANTAIRCLVVTGRGRAFCCGEDIRTDALTDADLDLLTALLDRIEAARMPVISAVNGFCAGGGFELALCSDIRLAADGASFICAGVNVGAIGGTYRLPRLIGIAAAKAMLLTGEPHDAAHLHRVGLLASLHARDELMPAALRLARRIASRAPLSAEAVKRMVARSWMAPEEVDRLFDVELKALIRTDDHREALAAFGAKREPVFRRR